jgi:hypothetical protein
MRVIRFPGAADADYGGPARPAAGEEIDAALNGEVSGADADVLRSLREDVRALAVAVDPDFERELQARVAEWGRQARAPRPGLRARFAALQARISGTRARLLAVGGAGAAVAVVILAIALSVGGGGATPREAQSNSSPASGEGSAQTSKQSENHSFEPLQTGSAGRAQQKSTASQPAVLGAGAASAGPVAAATGQPAPGRLQQLGASVALAAHGGQGVQEAADAVSRLASGDGGYVESSHVQVRQGGGPSEAQLHLSIPSAKLSAAIAALGRIAPLRAVSQESQDITSSYDNARRRLSDDEAVRRALLRALAAATTEGRIESLRERLASNREALSGDRARLHSISHTAATSQLEVTITGGAAAASHSGTLDRGLDDAGHVLAVAAAVALVALAVLVPLALLALLLEALRRTWQRRRREAALDS